MKRHMLLVGIGLAMALGAGVYLHRAASSVTPSPAAARESGARCAACHEKLVNGWLRSGHGTVDCEVCHGPPGDHLVETIDPRPKLGIKGPDHCLECHFPQNDEPDVKLWIEQLELHLKAIEKKHVTTIDRARVAGRCSFCHEPHSLE